MKLTSISASSIQTFEGCTARYQAEMVDRVPTPGGSSFPAKLGSSVHDALEIAVTRWYIKKEAEPNFAELVAYYKQCFMKHFGMPPQKDDEWYMDGLDMVERWFNRTSLENVEVLMVEQKREVEFKTSIGPVPYRFIFDRLDMFEENGKRIVRVVDYKTWRQYLTPSGLREKPQARLYAMAIAMEFKHLNADEIWVCFDQLRYDCVEAPFGPDENRETWRYVKKVAERIIAEPEPGRETLNSECMFCVRKATCKTLVKNVDAGGTLALVGDRNEMAKRLSELEGAAKAIKYAQEEVIELMLRDAMDSDEIDYETEDYHVTFKSSRRKTYDFEEVREIIGDSTFASMGKINNSEIDKLLKGDALTASQKSLLRSSAKESIGEPKPKIVKKLIKD